MNRTDIQQHEPPELRPGVALAMVVVAMAVLGALVAGVFFAAMRDLRDGRDSISRVRALAAAEHGLELALAPGRWQSDWNTSSIRGLLASWPYDPGSGTSDTVQIWKLTSNSFLVTSSAAAGSGLVQASRRVSLLVALRAPRLTILGAATARSEATIADESSISGFDAAPDQWICPPLADPIPALAIPAASMVGTEECTTSPCLVGDVDVRADSAAASADTYEQFGDIGRAAVVASAARLPGATVTITPAPSLNSSGECDHTEQRNMGDPLRLLGGSSGCADYFPVLHAPGDLHISGGAGQGFLLVDGDLTLDAGSQFFGAVVVRGSLSVSDGAEVHGAVLASRISLDGAARIQYSKCATNLALRAAAIPAVPPGQAWSEMY
ncbi:MAG TPA: hypothetical protein VIQ74_12320 [Gemmatimonadaceae bacterium]